MGLGGTGGGGQAGAAGGGSGGIAEVALTVAPVAGLTALINQRFSAQLEVLESVAAVRWELTGGALAPGLTLDETGVIAGVPTAAGAFDFDVEATADTGASGVAMLSLVVETRAWIAYRVLDRATNRYELSTVNLADSEPVLAVHPLAVGPQGDGLAYKTAAFSPNGRQFVYLQPRSEPAGTCEPLVVDLHSERTLAGESVGAGPVSCNDLSWSPSGHAVALERVTTGGGLPLVIRFQGAASEVLPLDVAAEYTNVYALMWVGDELLMWSATGEGLLVADLTDSALTAARAVTSVGSVTGLNVAEQRYVGPGNDGQVVIDQDDGWSALVPTSGILSYAIDPTLNWVVDGGAPGSTVDVYPITAFRAPSPLPLLSLDETILYDAAGIRRWVVGGERWHLLGMGDATTLWETELVADAVATYRQLPADCAMPRVQPGPWLTCRGLHDRELYVYAPGRSTQFLPLLPSGPFFTSGDPVFAPAGDFAALSGVVQEGDAAELYAVPLAADGTVGTAARISPALGASASEADYQNPVWTADGTHVLYVMNRSQSTAALYSQSLWTTPLGDGQPRPAVNVSGTNVRCSQGIDYVLGDDCTRVDGQVFVQPLPQ